MLNVLKNLDWSVLTDMLFAVIPALICITLHELAHGFAAYKMGDMTAKYMGRLTLNPLKHIDPVGFIMMVAFKFGWAKPVPVDMRNFKNPKRGMALTALAGPVTNILLGIAVLFLYGFLFPFLTRTAFGQTVLSVVYTTAYLSFALAVFNIIPIPPLDGSKVLFSVISDRAYYKLMYYERYGSILLLVLIAAGVLRRPLAVAVAFLSDKLFFVADFAFDLVSRFF